MPRRARPRGRLAAPSDPGPTQKDLSGRVSDPGAARGRRFAPRGACSRTCHGLGEPKVCCPPGFAALLCDRQRTDLHFATVPFLSRSQVPHPEGDCHTSDFGDLCRRVGLAFAGGSGALSGATAAADAALSRGPRRDRTALLSLPDLLGVLNPAPPGPAPNRSAPGSRNAMLERCSPSTALFDPTRGGGPCGSRPGGGRRGQRLRVRWRVAERRAA